VLPTKKDEVYHILVATSAKNQYLSWPVFEVAAQPLTPADNDFCTTAKAIAVPPVSSTGVSTIQGDTSNAALDMDPCRAEQSSATDGAVWYVIEDGVLTAGQTVQVVYKGDTVLLSVLQGESCDTRLTCITAVDATSGSRWFKQDHTVTWVASGGPYWILVRQVNDIPGVHSFTLEVSSLG
jgi:hypothetical protein